MNLHSISTQLKRVEEKLQMAKGMMRVHTLHLPVDAPKSVAKRMEAEARATIPPMDDLRFDSFIVISWLGDGSKYDPAEKWRLEGGNYLQECVR